MGFRIEWSNFETLCDEFELIFGAGRQIRRWNLVRERRLASGEVDWLKSHEAELNLFAESLDAAVIGVADGGSSTYWSVQDWAHLQTRGIPSVLVVAEAYKDHATRLAALEGYSTVPMVTVPHPFHALPRSEIILLAPRTAQEVLAIL